MDSTEDYFNILLNGGCLSKVPEDQRTEEMSLIYVENSDRPNLSLIPDGFRSYDICCKAISKHLNNWPYIPKGKYTFEYDIYYKVVRFAPSVIYEMSRDMWDEKLFMRILENGYNMKFLIDARIKPTEKMIVNWIINFPYLLDFLPDCFLNQDLLIQVINSIDVTKIDNILDNIFNPIHPKKILLTEKFWLIVLDRNIIPTRYMAPNIWTEKLALTAIEKCPSSLDRFPREVKTRKIITAAIDRDPHLFYVTNIYDIIFDDELYIRIYEARRDDLREREIFKDLTKLLTSIPSHLLTLNICLEILEYIKLLPKYIGDIISYFPEEIRKSKEVNIIILDII